RIQEQLLHRPLKTRAVQRKSTLDRLSYSCMSPNAIRTSVDALRRSVFGRAVPRLEGRHVGKLDHDDSIGAANRLPVSRAPPLASGNDRRTARSSESSTLEVIRFEFGELAGGEFEPGIPGID